MKNNKTIISIALIIVAIAGGFFAGVKYQQNKRSNLVRQFGQQAGQGRMMGTRPVNGEIIAVDEKSITVKMTDNSSKIVILSDKTQINKAAEAGKTDLKVGEKVAAFGQENSDGSITAVNIQLNPIQIQRGNQ